jgi:hypothetical protein
MRFEEVPNATLVDVHGSDETRRSDPHRIGSF